MTSADTLCCWESHNFCFRLGPRDQGLWGSDLNLGKPSSCLTSRPALTQRHAGPSRHTLERRGLAWRHRRHCRSAHPLLPLLPAACCSHCWCCY